MVYYEETNPCDIPLERVVKLLQNIFPTIERKDVKFIYACLVFLLVLHSPFFDTPPSNSIQEGTFF